MKKNPKRFNKRDVLMFLAGFILMDGIGHAWGAYNNISFTLFYTLSTTGNWILAAVSVIGAIALVWWAIKINGKNMMANPKTFTKRDFFMLVSGFILMNGIGHAWLAYNDITFSFIFYTLNTTGNWITAIGSVILTIVLLWWVAKTNDKKEN